MGVRVLTLSALGGAVLAGCGGGDTSTQARSVVVRPSHAAPTLPRASANRCPVSARGEVSPAYGPGLGRGPIYPIGFGPGAVLRIFPPRNFASHEWGGEKVLWVRRPGTRGDVVIRGRRLDEPDDVRFNYGDVPPDHLTLPDPKPGSGWVDFPSHTRVRAPGCYAYTVQGPGIREVIVFRVVRARVG